MRCRLLRTALLVAALGTLTHSAQADEPLSPPVALRHDLRVDLPVVAGLGAGALTWYFVRDDVAPKGCRWCDREVNAVDAWFQSALRRPDTQPAKVASVVFAYGFAPASAAVLRGLAAIADRRSENLFVDAVIVAEGGLVAYSVTQVLQPIALRPQPYVLAIGDERAREAEIAAGGALRSFPSEHVTAAFGAASASGVVATMRGYRLAPLVWIAGMTFAVASAYTRMAADRAYFTDTLAGAAIGIAVGGGVPLLFHRPVEGMASDASVFGRTRVMTSAVTGGQVIGVTGSF